MELLKQINLLTNKFVDIPVQDEQTLDKLEKIIRVF